MDITEKLIKAKVHLDAWETAELEVTTHQSYSIGSRSLTKANLSEIRKQIMFWQNQVTQLENMAKRRGRNRIVRVVMRDL